MGRSVDHDNPNGSAAAEVPDGLRVAPDGKVELGELRMEEGVARLLGVFEGRTSFEQPQDDEPEKPAEERKSEPLTSVVSDLVIVEPPRRRRWQRIAGLTMVGLALAWGGLAWSLWSRPAASAPPLVAPASSRGKPATYAAVRSPRRTAQVESDAAGDAVAIRGPDPATVLAAWCRFGGNAGRLEPLGTSNGARAQPGVVLGHFAEVADASRTRAIRIFLDPRTGRWQAGDGRSSIDPVAPGAAFDLRPFGATGPPEVDLVVTPAS